MRKILLVDNDITFIWGLKKYLQRRGYAVETAATLAEAREMIKQEAPLLICSDLCLPDGTALELFHDIRHISEKLGKYPPPLSCYHSLLLQQALILPRNINTNTRVSATILRPRLISRN